jgi:hypothetical protein
MREGQPRATAIVRAPDRSIEVYSRASSELAEARVVVGVATNRRVASARGAADGEKAEIEGRNRMNRSPATIGPRHGTGHERSAKKLLQAPFDLDLEAFHRVAWHDVRDGTVIPMAMDGVRVAERPNGIQIAVVFEADEVQHIPPAT